MEHFIKKVKSIEMENNPKILTEEQKQKITIFLDKFFSDDELTDNEYITEYDILMEQKNNEFKMILLRDHTETLIEICCKEKNSDTIGAELGLIMAYDMWINESSTFPTYNPKLWEKWEKLKKIKVKKREETVINRGIL